MQIWLRFDGRKVVLGMVSDRGGCFGFVYRARFKVYAALRRKGMSKSKAARISNEGYTRAGRSMMGRKGVRTRRARGRQRR
ncbi:hypothetical protein [Streptomyces sp. NPDC085596]|uniref:DUF7218 family protein n=1 Tax=Streptomyces sp. NPDC085596 TaxID=3365731 RepID=UPI0037D05647